MNLELSYLILFVSAIIILAAGTRLTRVADRLADIIGWGEAITGAIFLGITTSLPGIVTSAVAAYEGHAELAVSNAIGGIAAQTLFLSIADISYPKINLEHASASLANIMQSILLLCLLSLVILGMSGPKMEILGVHPYSFLMILVYIGGTRLVTQGKNEPMWSPKETVSTVKDEPDEEHLRDASLRSVLLQFIPLALITAIAGYGVAESGIHIVRQTGMSESFVGALFTAVATSLPELVVSIAAVRQKALALAVGNIVGGNTFDVLFVAISDGFYREGSILHAITRSQLYMVSLTMLMIGVVVMGMLHRERKGIGTIGWESFMVVVLYLAGMLVLFL